MAELQIDTTELGADARQKSGGGRARRAAIDSFLRSITPDQYAPDTYVPWNEIDAITQNLAEPIARLQTIVDKRRITPAN